MRGRRETERSRLLPQLRQPLVDRVISFRQVGIGGIWRQQLSTDKSIVWVDPANCESCHDADQTLDVWGIGDSAAWMPLEERTKSDGESIHVSRVESSRGYEVG